MTPPAGTVVFWRDFAPGHDKFVYVVGTDGNGDVLAFTISSQTKYLAMRPHAVEMVRIPLGTAQCFTVESFIHCFYEVTRTPLDRFEDLQKRGTIRFRASLPQFLPAVRAVVQRSELLDGYDREAVLEALPF